MNVGEGRGLKVVQDNMTVQGAMMHRLENNLRRPI